MKKLFTLLALFLNFITLFGNDSMIYELIQDSPFVIEKEKVETLKEMTGLEMEALLHKLIPIAKSFARPPISNYQVGVVALGKSGTLYLGVNLEFPGVPLNESVHGEQFLVVNARSHGEKELEMLALSAAPCGHCRQFLYEMGKNTGMKIVIPHIGSTSLASLLPEAFGPQDLGLAATLMVMPKELPSIEEQSPLLAKALQAAFASYAPYSEAKSGVAIQTKDGSIYTGSYLENAAFNPSLSPLQAALIALVIDKQAYSTITHVILAEKKEAKITHTHSIDQIIKNIAPQATLENILF